MPAYFHQAPTNVPFRTHTQTSEMTNITFEHVQIHPRRKPQDESPWIILKMDSLLGNPPIFCIYTSASRGILQSSTSDLLEVLLKIQIPGSQILRIFADKQSRAFHRISKDRYCTKVLSLLLAWTILTLMDVSSSQRSQFLNASFLSIPNSR